ncbi:hypothetical protein [Rhizobium laguerreae]|uniref:hypothetical protein n=1 Tax=Rhizobium laguerreae TaxID=1076926 RepID=UPI001441426F|nr:hypothetical protein [Rhizobium laguerreae]NKM24947.1 hypothetical protein [Rhizobium laguerreae]
MMVSNSVGRPSSFQPQVERLCRTCAIDTNIAEFFNVAVSTVYERKKEFGEFFRRMPAGKIVRLTNEAVIRQGRKYVYGLDGSHIAEVRRLMGKRDFITLLPNMAKHDGEDEPQLLPEVCDPV